MDTAKANQDMSERERLLQDQLDTLTTDKAGLTAELDYIRREDMLDETGRTKPVLIQSKESKLVQKLHINEFLYRAQQSKNPIPMLIEKLSHLLELLHTASTQADVYLQDLNRSNGLVSALRQKNLVLYEKTMLYDSFKTKAQLKYVTNCFQSDDPNLYLDGLNYTSKELSGDMDRTADAKTKTGVPTDSYAVHPLTGEDVPIWVADYVLGAYGTGAVMAVPAHDTRDFAFAEAFDLPIVRVVDGGDLPYTDPGTCVNSGEFDGLKTGKAKKAVTYKLSQSERGEKKVTYKLRDWVFSRQRYWGEPIPITFPVLDSNGAPLREDALDPRVADEGFEIDFSKPEAVPVSQLPLQLPETDDYAPGEDPAGCLARIKDWRFYVEDGHWRARETNTMPQWAGSCWYYLRYADNGNDAEFISQQNDKDWLPVDLYVGGAEHAVLHLLYARFWHLFLYDQNKVQ